MEFFYAIEGKMFIRDRYYKVYIKEEELWLGRIGRQLYGMKQLSGKSIVLNILFSLFRRVWIVPRGKKREKELDAIFSGKLFLKKKGNVIIRFDEINDVTINELQSLHTWDENGGTLTLKLVDGKEIQLILEAKTSLNHVEAIFHQIPVKRIDYWW
ncbi:hypothetical protein [Rummeliibacillus pycnus]|uniref:hypothetical protein n=1 Tax=Rummeliibacillus pycnus TaxID=101070 RepID=UPI003D293E68